MKRNFFVLILLLFSCNNAPQEKEISNNNSISISNSNSLDWFKKYYPNQESLQQRISYFYELLEHPIDQESILYLYSEQELLAKLLTKNIKLDVATSYEEHERIMTETLDHLNEVNIPGFNFGCAIECSELLVSINLKQLTLAARKTNNPLDDIGLQIIIDTWGLIPEEAPRSQSIECCGCNGMNTLGNGFQFKLLQRVKNYSEETTIFSEELEKIKTTLKYYLFNNDGFTMDKLTVLNELAQIKDVLEFTEEETTKLSILESLLKSTSDTQK